jgi:hypothetical protein
MIGIEQKPTTSMQLPGTSMHSERVPEEYRDLPDDLARVFASWPDLSQRQKAQILAIVKAG